MSDEEIIKRLARLQARGELGAAQARVFVTGGWLPFPEWDLIYAARLQANVFNPPQRGAVTFD